MGNKQERLIYTALAKTYNDPKNQEELLQYLSYVTVGELYYCVKDGQYSKIAKT